MKKSRVLSFKYILYDFIRFTAFPGVLWFRPKRLYASEAAKRKIRGGALVICNHMGRFDPMYLMMGIWYRRHHFIAATELFRKNFTRKLFTKGFHCIEIDRENFGISTFKTIVEHLHAGELVSMFPEGRVNFSESGELQAFKSGMVLMAFKGGVPIVPVYLQRRKHFYSRLVVAIGEPIELKNFTAGEKATLAEIAQATQYLHDQELLLEKICSSQDNKTKGE